MLRDAGWQLNAKRVERLWRREGLKVPMRQPMRSRCGSGSMADRAFVSGRSTSITFGHTTLSIIDEYSRECLAIRVKRKLNSTDVIDALTDLFIIRDVPTYIRSDNGPEFTAEAVRQWIKAVGAETEYIEPVSPWENGYCKSFNPRFRDELLNGGYSIP